ncbi:hypothetical protein [Azospirillum picis]|uniref:Tail assembly chaperone n=1 Tax=Azospirillum picis TaxID=488438 RepID=A0ABU0MPS2_9PROT|nr:hypothetical protein [Azospirillum picis]MBP2301310.1 hypothetical protein [Azospirillum picis]MDQ0535141.1 hypothetical protein [Azospirillum picis]
MSKPVFVLDGDLTVDAPVLIQVPTSARTTGGVARQSFKTSTAYVTFRVPTEDELDTTLEEVASHNERLTRQINEADKERTDAADDETRAAVDRKLTELRRDVRTAQIEQLKAFIVALPSGHGFAEKDGTPCEFSPELIGRLCQYRAVRNALWAAFLLVLNGDPKKGN